MDLLHGLCARLHGIHGLEIDVGILNGHDLRLDRHTRAHKSVKWSTQMHQRVSDYENDTWTA